MDKLADLLSELHQTLEVDLPDLIDIDPESAKDSLLLVAEMVKITAQMVRICAWRAVVAG